MNLYVLDSSGRPVAEEDVLTWARWFENADDKRIVNKTTIGSAEVSTVFLGSDHAFDVKSDAPVLYETMVFGGKMDQEMDRYSTKEEALEGHLQMCGRVTGCTS